jgi:DNA-binding SARP family transcriptional activator/tetratricopeptide (TPR) repeat protein
LKVPAPLEFRILGPLDVRGESGSLDLGPAKQRALLAILLLHRNEVVSKDRLIEELWAEPPATAHNTLQVYVGKLRKALEPERPPGAPGVVLFTRAPGYALNVDGGQLDSERFESLIEDGRRAREAGANELAMDRLREALGLWRGPALVDFTYEPFAQVEIARLEELRIEALEERFDVELAQGRHAELVALLEAHVAEHPLRERPRGQLMVALYRCGRQVEALEVYRQTRQTLVDELGIEPGPTLRHLEAAILNQEPTLEYASPAGAKGALLTPTAEPAGPVGEPGIRKTVTVLVAGAAGEPRLDPETLARWGEMLRGAASRAAGGYGGVLTEARGDEVTLVFGVPLVHEDDARRAVDAAIRLRDSVATEPDAEPRVGVPGLAIGIATGEVLAEQESGRSAVVGDVVSIAHRLIASAAPGEIVLAEQTYRLVGGQARADPLEAASTRAWRLVELVSEPPPLASWAQSSLVGRHGELRRLELALERAVDERTPQMLSIIGPPGIGKSRLAAAFTASPPHGAGAVAGRCMPYGEGITFRPLREIVEQLGGPTSLPGLLAEEELGALAAARLVDASEGSKSPNSAEDVFWATATLFRALARRTPLVALFEDVHWAEPTFLDLLSYLHRTASGSPILLICVARPELLEQRLDWGTKGPASDILLLGPLSESESRALAEHLAQELSDSVRARVLAAAEGNPLFIEQLAANITELRDRERDVHIPPTIQAVLAARLDRLGPGERALVARAAVIGRDFDPDGAVALLPPDARTFAAHHLRALIEKELVGRVATPTGKEGLRFGHALIQQAAYRAIPKHLRAELHESFGAWLEQVEAPTEAGQPEVVGHHLEQAFRYRAELGPVNSHERTLGRRAAALLGGAGRRVFRQGDMPAAANLLERAASLLRATGADPLDLLPDLGYALFEVGDLESAIGVLAETETAARRRDMTGIEWAARAKRLHVQLYADPSNANLDEMVATARRAVDILGRVGDHAGLSRAWIMLSEALYSLGQVETAEDAGRRAAEHARRYGSRREEAWALGQTAFCTIYGPTPVQSGLEWVRASLASAPGNPVMEANMLPFLASLEAMSGHTDEARSHVASGRALIRDLGLTWQAGIHDWFSGEIEMLAGDPVAAECRYREALAACEAIDDAFFRSLVAVSLPAAVYAQRRQDEAWDLVAGLEESSSAPGDVEWGIRRRGVHAKLLARAADPEGGEVLAREAVSLAATSDFLGLHADALLDLAEILRWIGRADEASPAIEEAVGLYGRKGNVVSADRARALLTHAG